MDYDPRSLHYFAHGTYAKGDRRYEELFRPYRMYRWEDHQPHPRYVSLVGLTCDGNGKPHSRRTCPMRARTGACTCRAQWAVIDASSERAGTIVWSNCRKPGTRVRTRACWYYIKKRRSPDSVETIGHPMSLEVVARPSAVKGPIAYRFAA